MNFPSSRFIVSAAVAAASVAVTTHLSSAETKPGVTIDWAPAKASSANTAIMAYLGEPVPPPANMDSNYTADGLTTAFQSLCQKAGFKVQQLAVDDTEFPFLVYGVIEGRHNFREIQPALRAMQGYTYGGSVVGNTAAGQTFFSLNMTPSGPNPRDRSEAIRRRLMIRLQMVAARVQ